MSTIIRTAVKILSEFMLRFENTPLNDHVKFDHMSNLLENRLYTTHFHTANQHSALSIPTHTQSHPSYRLIEMSIWWIFSFWPTLRHEMWAWWDYRFYSPKYFILCSTHMRQCPLCTGIPYFFFSSSQHFIFKMFQSNFSCNSVWFYGSGSFFLGNVEHFALTKSNFWQFIKPLLSSSFSISLSEKKMISRIGSDQKFN